MKKKAEIAQQWEETNARVNKKKAEQEPMLCASFKRLYGNDLDWGPSTLFRRKHTKEDEGGEGGEGEEGEEKGEE